MAEFSTFDHAMMERAIGAARRVLGTTRPNPAVGAVVARGSDFLSEGSTQPPGGPHAEIVAMGAADPAALKGATLYVTLEPCNHTGRTGPCTEAIIAAGIASVVVAARDPHREASGGIERLRAAGIAVEDGLFAERARLTNPGFHTFHMLGRPLVTLKWAMTLDGSTSTPTGDSKWITDSDARREAHRMRAAHDATLAGIGTVLRDEARLSVRDAVVPPGPPLRRIVLDTEAKLPPDSPFVQERNGIPTVVCAMDADPARIAALEAAGAEVWKPDRDPRGGVELPDLLALCHTVGVQSILVEGGRKVAGRFLEDDLADRVSAFLAPSLLGAGGGNQGPFLLGLPPVEIGLKRSLQHVDCRPVGSSFLLEGWLATHLLDGQPRG